MQNREGNPPLLLHTAIGMGMVMVMGDGTIGGDGLKLMKVMVMVELNDDGDNMKMRR